MKRKLVIALAILLLASLALAACQPAPKVDKVRVATDATWPPFEMVDETTKEVIGFDVDLMNAIAKKAGFEVEFVNVPFDSALAGISQCQYELSISAITITDDRKLTMLFSDPYFAAGQIVTVHMDNQDIKGMEDLSGKKVGAMIGTTGAIEAEAIPGVDYAAYDTIDLAFLDVMSGQIDAVIADNELAYGFVKQNPTKLKVVGEVFTGELYGVAVCKNRTDLLEKVNKALAAVKGEGLIDELVTKWIGDE